MLLQRLTLERSRSIARRLQRVKDIPGEELPEGWIFFGDIYFIQEWLGERPPQDEESLAEQILDEINAIEFPSKFEEEPPQPEWFDVPVMAGQRKTMRGTNKSIQDMAQQLVAEFMGTEAKELVKGAK